MYSLVFLVQCFKINDENKVTIIITLIKIIIIIIIIIIIVITT